MSCAVSCYQGLSMLQCRQVSWSGLQSPSIYDAVALVVPADADANLTAPVKHRWCTESPTHLTQGAGSLT